MPLARRAAVRPEEIDWEEEAKAILKAELKRRKLTYSDLAERFGELGFPMTEPTLRNKISRGSFSAVFFLQCLAALDCSTLYFQWAELQRSGQVAGQPVVPIAARAKTKR